MKWQVKFFNKKVEKETLSFPPKILAKFLHILEIIEELGPNIGEPYIKYLSNGLLEIRVKAQEELAKRMHTSKSNISRLESLNNTYIPNLSTIIKYANALNCKINFEII